eukprot:1377814-Amorphochlora_amoeboformis.AAC.1
MVHIQRLRNPQNQRTSNPNRTNLNPARNTNRVRMPQASESDYFRPSAIQELELLFTGSKLNSHPDTSSSKSLKSLEFATLP